MNYSDRPPLASESLLGNDIKRQSDEAWQRELKRPVPYWVNHPGKKCTCGITHTDSEVIAVYRVPLFGPLLLRMQCQCCGLIWIEQKS